MSFGENLQFLRKQKNITQEQLAEMVDCSSAHISHIETGNTIPSVEMLITIINKLGISSDAILCDSVHKADHIYKDELNELFMDCSESEVKYIVEMAKENLRIYRKYKAVNNEGEPDE